MSPTPPPPGSRSTAAIPDADLFLSDVSLAKRMTAEERGRAGFELFVSACEMTRAGLRHDYPGADAAEIERLLRDRLAKHRRMEEWGIYTYRPMTPEEAGE